MRAATLAGLALGLSTLLTAAPVAGEWLPAQRAEFMQNCIGGCQTNQSVRPDEKSLCPAYCRCVADAGERLFSPEDYDDIDGQARRGTTSERLLRFQLLFAPCGREIFGR